MILDPSAIARAGGLAGGEARPTEANAAHGAMRGHGDGERTALLLFRAGGTELKAVPLGLVARIEQIPAERIELSSGKPVTQYRGALMPLVPLAGAIDPDRPSYAVLVFADPGQGVGRDRAMGLVVDEILDVTEDRLHMELSGGRPGILGTAIVAGHATDVIDTAYWLAQAHNDWFGSVAGSSGRLLVVEDSEFFRHLVVPALAASGYQVTAVASAAEALRLRDAGVDFEAIISDVTMPDMDGFAFVRRVRAEGPWRSLPVIALTGRTGAEDIATGRDAGFTDYVAKYERDALLTSLRQCLAHASAVAG
jgi:two-component system chemotaxis sensor kinase CheA